MATVSFRATTAAIVISSIAVIAPGLSAQDQPRRPRMNQVERLQPPGALPRIDSLSPAGPDGTPFLRPGETFVIIGNSFSSVPGQTRIGIRTWADGTVTIPPQQNDFVASILPSSAGTTRLEAIAPGGIATGRYLLWIYVEGAGHSAPIEFRFSNPEQPSGKDPRITKVTAGYPDLETVIHGANFAKDTTVQWPVGLAQVATCVNATTIKTRIPKGLTPGQHQVRVEVNGRWSQSATAQVLEPKPINMYWDRTDRNGIPLNPRWGWQLTHDYGSPGYYPKPTDWRDQTGPLGLKWDWSRGTDQELSYDNGWFGCGPHVNWHRIPVTFTGYWWWSHKSPWAEDDDYNFYFFPPDGAGATDRGERNPGGIMTEFDSGKTIDHFHTSWWTELRDAVDDESDRAGHLVNGKYGIVAGRWGLDCAHDCYAEIHPVWAMALLAKDDPYEDRWSMFLRPWGDQGFCGNKNHYIRFRVENGKEVYTFELPWRPGASSVKWSQEFLCNGACSLSVKPLPGEAVLVSLKYPAGADKARINGQLKLNWSYPAGTSPGYYSFSQTARANVAAAMGRPADPGNREYWRAMEKLSAEQQNAINQKMKTVMAKPSPARDAVAVQIEALGAGLQVAPANLPKMATDPDQIKVQRMTRLDAIARPLGVTTVMGENLQPTAPSGTHAEEPVQSPISPPSVVLEFEQRLDEAPGEPRPVTLEPGTNRPGHDYRDFDLPAAEPEVCRDACSADEICRAYTYVRPGIQGDSARCWLKSEAAPAEPAPCCVSGAKE